MKLKYLLILSLYFVVCSCLYQTTKSYEVSAESMKPSLAPSDIVFVDTNISDITYGDIVVYENREDGAYDKEIYIFRIVGLPNDTIQIENEIPIINGQKNRVQKKNVPPYIAYGVTFDRLEEELPNGVKIETLCFAETTPNIATDIISDVVYIPENHYFVMGDFRSNAYDSRHSGAISSDQILGKVVRIEKKSSN